MMEMTTSNAREKMRSLRDEWRSVGFEEVNLRVYIGDKELLTSLGLVLMGKRIISTIEGGGDTGLELALTLADKYTLRRSVSLREVTLWRADNEATLKSKVMSARYDKVFNALTAQVMHERVAANARAHMESQGPSSEKYEEAAINAGLCAGNAYLANGYWRMMRSGDWVDV